MGLLPICGTAAVRMPKASEDYRWLLWQEILSLPGSDLASTSSDPRAPFGTCRGVGVGPSLP